VLAILSFITHKSLGLWMLIFTKANKIGLETLIFQSLTFRELGLGFGPGNPIDTEIQRGARRRFMFSLKLALLRDSLPPSRALECLFGGSAAEALICWLRCVAAGKMPPKLDPSQVVEVYVRVTGMSIHVHFPSFSQLLVVCSCIFVVWFSWPTPS
jgi:hypothetical protein